MSPLTPNFLEVIITLIGLAHIILALFALYRTGTNRTLTLQKKFIFLFIIFVLPLIGPLFTIYQQKTKTNNSH